MRKAALSQEVARKTPSAWPWAVRELPAIFSLACDIAHTEIINGFVEFSGIIKNFQVKTEFFRRLCGHSDPGCIFSAGLGGAKDDPSAEAHRKGYKVDHLLPKNTCGMQCTVQREGRPDKGLDRVDQGDIGGHELSPSHTILKIQDVAQGLVVRAKGDEFRIYPLGRKVELCRGRWFWIDSTGWWKNSCGQGEKDLAMFLCPGHVFQLYMAQQPCLEPAVRLSDAFSLDIECG